MSGEDFADAAAFGVQFAGVDQLFEVFGSDVDKGFHLSQCPFQILGGN